MLLIARDKTRGAGDQEMLGLTALSSVPYDLWTVDSNLKSLRDLDPQKNKIGLPAAKVSVPAIFLQMASEQINGIGKHAAFDPLTVSLAQPDGLISLTGRAAAPSTAICSRRPSASRCATSRTCTACGRAPSCSAARSPRSRAGPRRAFIARTPSMVAAFVAAIRDAIELIRTDKARAAGIYVKAEPSKLPAEYFAKVLEDPDVRFTLAPENSIKIAEYLARIGTLKQKPSDWKDTFFPELHTENGS